MMKIIRCLMLSILLFFVGVSGLHSQDMELIKAIKLVPLNCLDDVLERSSDVKTIVVDGENSLNEECIDRVRITFQNSEVQQIRYLKFDLSIFELNDGIEQLIYKGRHIIPIIILPEEVISYDLQLFNKLSPPTGHKNFDDETSWGWRVDIVRINPK